MRYNLLFLVLIISAIFSCGETESATNSTTTSDTVFVETPKNQEKGVTTLQNSSHDSNIDRMIWQKPDKVLELIDNLKYCIVGDIGAGSGYFSFEMLPLAKKVIAIDIDPQAIAFLQDTKDNLLSEELQEKFEIRFAKENDPLLQVNEVDAILMVNTFMYIKKRIEYLKKVKAGMKPNGQILIIDFKKKRLPIGPPSNQKTTLNEVENDLIQAGFNVVLSDDNTLDYQYIVKALNN